MEHRPRIDILYIVCECCFPLCGRENLCSVVLCRMCVLESALASPYSLTFKRDVLCIFDLEGKTCLRTGHIFFLLQHPANFMEKFTGCFLFIPTGRWPVKVFSFCLAACFLGGRGRGVLIFDWLGSVAEVVGITVLFLAVVNMIIL